MSGCVAGCLLRRGKEMIISKSAIAGAVLGLMATSALAFQETTIGGGDEKAPPAGAMELPKAGAPGKGLQINGSELSLGKTPGTEVRIPGIGTVGILPKLDFGLELLYGANEPKGVPQDPAQSDDVQIRGTIKHRF
jgi:hypothetical protein